MCEGQEWCANPYIREDIIQLDCGAFSEYVIATISLWKRGVLTGQITGDYVAADWLSEEMSWGLWAACNFPSALVTLLGSGVIGHAASGTSCPSIAEAVMDAVTDGLAHGPSVRVPLDGAELVVELRLADTGMTREASEASCGWWREWDGSG
ncbi:hypothetical protein TSOC111612_11480 [Tsukamurella ocularis]|uniref:hypothetical protein n=1 Tax=Tsukamurella ocularis TaxID=1970234 RepID=UPI0039EECDC1